MLYQPKFTSLIEIYLEGIRARGNHQILNNIYIYIYYLCAQMQGRVLYMLYSRKHSRCPLQISSEPMRDDVTENLIQRRAYCL